MLQTQEKVIEIVSGLELYGFAAANRYIAVFTNQRIIFIKAAGNWGQAMFGLVGELASRMQAEKMATQLKNMNVEQILAGGEEKIVVEKIELDSIQFSEWPQLFRSKIVVQKDGKKRTFKATKKPFLKFREMYESLRNGNADILAAAKVEIAVDPLAAPVQEESHTMGIKIIGSILVAIGALASIGGWSTYGPLVLLRTGVFLVIGILLLLRLRWGFYLLSFLSIISFIGLLGELATQPSPTYIAYVVVLGILAFYVWNKRSALK